MRYIGILLAIWVVSCKSFEKGIEGRFVKSSQDYNYTLNINNDSTFSLITQSIHARSGCTGRWELKKDTLILKCGEEPFPAQISSGYMNEREKQIRVINRNKIKYEQIVMRRIKG